MTRKYNNRLAKLERAYALTPFTAVEFFAMLQRRATGHLTPDEYIALIDAGHLTIEELHDCELDLQIEHLVKNLSDAEVRALMDDVQRTIM
jgi:hypothetical protein